MKSQICSIPRLNLTAAGTWLPTKAGQENVPPDYYVAAAIINAVAGDGGHSSSVLNLNIQ
jgi:hypothetical protein